MNACKKVSVHLNGNRKSTTCMWLWNSPYHVTHSFSSHSTDTSAWTSRCTPPPPSHLSCSKITSSRTPWHMSRSQLVRVLIPHIFYSVPKTVTRSTLLEPIFSCLSCPSQVGVQSSVSISQIITLYCIIYFSLNYSLINHKIRVVSISSFFELEDY